MEHITNGLKHGTIELVILSMLKEDDKYGYQLVREMRTRSKGSYTVQEGTLYATLYNLLKKGLVSEHKELAGKKRIRIYYHLEPSGVTYLKTLRREYNNITKGICNVLNYI